MDGQLLDSTILEIVTKYPDAREVFIQNGFPLFADDQALHELGAILKLKTALRTKNVGEEGFLQLLKDKLEDDATYNSLLASLVVNRPGNFNFVAQVPCGLKVPLERELQLILQQMQQGTGVLLNYYTGACCNDLLNLNDCIPHYQDIDEVPDLILTKGYHLLNKNFREKFVNRGYYATRTEQQINPQLAGFDLAGNDGSYQPMCLAPTVMVVDRRRLGRLPMPRTWGDLLEPAYEGKVVMNCYGDNFSDVVLLNIFKEYGDAGIAALGRSIHSGSHAAQMVKGMTNNKADLPPIYVMSDFFAHTISSADVHIIWPEDGALVMPVYFMVKAEKAEELKALTAFLTSPEVGKICADAYFPSTHRAVQNKLPPGAKCKWLGWEFLMERDIDGLTERLNNLCKASSARGRKVPSAGKGELAVGKG